MSEQAVGAVRLPARKRQQRSVVTQQKLLDAATEAFSENGFKGTSTRDIAERAGVHHPLITYHFKNKSLLWQAVADRIFSEFRAAMLTRPAADADADSPGVSDGSSDGDSAGDRRRRAEAFIRNYVRYAQRHPALHKIVLQESSHPSERLDWLIEKHLRPMSREMSGHIERLQSFGIAPPGNPVLLFNLMRVSAGGVLALSLEIKGTSGIDFDADGAVDELADLIIRCYLPQDSA